MQNPRRRFLKTTALFSLAPLASPLISAAQKKEDNQGNGFTFLFQGDSITDGNRSRNNDWNHLMGHGYVYLISSRLWYGFPKKDFHFINRGISGNKTTDLLARWQEDTIAIKPDVLSLLIGINDVAALMDGDNNFDAAHYEANYRNLVRQTQQQLPRVTLVLCEPFALPVGKIKDRWIEYQTNVAACREVVKKLAAETKSIYVPFQEAFTNALQQAPAEYWIWDGIHPMPAGHELMARIWLKAVGERLLFIRQ